MASNVNESRKGSHRLLLSYRCRTYLLTLVRQLLLILPDHAAAARLSSLKYFTPEESLKRVGRVARCAISHWDQKLEALPRTAGVCSPAEPGVDLDVLGKQWTELVLTDWSLYFGGNIPSSTVKFWTGVYAYVRGGERKYEQLARFALRVLSLPISNAAVERAFSIMNAIKIRSRNRMSTVLLIAIMRVRLWLRSRGKCCKDDVTQTILTSPVS